MTQSREAEYVLTVVQHTYCGDCIWIKGKITDVYHASSIVRGEESKHWRMHIFSPPWEREARRTDFPSGFRSVDVPAMKLEVDRQLVFATQDPDLIGEILVKLKVMLMARQNNSQIEAELKGFVSNWKGAANPAACVVSST